MRKCLFAALLFTTVIAKAQDETVKSLSKDASITIKKPEDTVQKEWKRGGVYNLNLAQGSLNNWAAGGDNFSVQYSDSITPPVIWTPIAADPAVFGDSFFVQDSVTNAHRFYRLVSP